MPHLQVKMKVQFVKFKSKSPKLANFLQVYKLVVPPSKFKIHSGTMQQLLGLCLRSISNSSLTQIR